MCYYDVSVSFFWLTLYRTNMSRLDPAINLMNWSSWIFMYTEWCPICGWIGLATIIQGWLTLWLIHMWSSNETIVNPARFTHSTWRLGYELLVQSQHSVVIEPCEMGDNRGHQLRGIGGYGNDVDRCYCLQYNSCQPHLAHSNNWSVTGH